MLTAIEGRLEELFETVESLPADRVEQAEKVWEHTHTHTNTFCTILVWFASCHPTSTISNEQLDGKPGNKFPSVKPCIFTTHHPTTHTHIHSH